MKISVFILAFLLLLAPHVEARKPVVVLPQEFAGRTVYIEGSTEFYKLVQGHTELEKQLEEEKREFEASVKLNDEALRQREKDIESLRESLAKARSEKSFLSSLFKWSWGLFGLSILALGVLCVFNPAILVSIINVTVNIVKFVARFFGKAVDGLDKITSAASKTQH
jgi:hypothetical protein